LIWGWDVGAVSGGRIRTRIVVLHRASANKVLAPRLGKRDYKG